MKKLACIIFVVLLCSGCGKSLNALMRFDKEQKAIQRSYAAQTKRYEMLLADIEANKLKTGEFSKSDIYRIYGDPVLVKEYKGKQSFLYRNPTDFFPDKKVYLFFDSEDILIDFEIKEKNQP